MSADELAAFSHIYDVSVEWLASGESSLDSDHADRIQLAARHLSRLKPEDIDTVLRLLRTLHKPGDANS